eukprot:s3632_g7.t1
MYEARDGEDVLSSAERISVKVSTVTKPHAWKTPVPASVAWSANRKGGATQALGNKGSVNYIKSLVIFSQITAVRAQGQVTQWINPTVLYILAFIGLITIYVMLYQLGRLITNRLFPPQGEEQLEPVEGTEVRLQLDDTTVRLNITAYRDGSAEAPEEEDLTPGRIERWYEERWMRRGAENNMTLQELIEWRMNEERLIHGQGQESSPEVSPSHSADSPTERTAPPRSGKHRLSGKHRRSPGSARSFLMG